MSYKRHGDRQWKRKPIKINEIKEQTNQPLVSMSVSHRRLIFARNACYLIQHIQDIFTSYPTQSSLELLLFPYRPPVMVLHNRLQSHCHLNRCRCNRTSHHDQYRYYRKIHYLTREFRVKVDGTSFQVFWICKLWKERTKSQLNVITKFVYESIAKLVLVQKRQLFCHQLLPWQRYLMIVQTYFWASKAHILKTNLVTPNFFHMSFFVIWKWNYTII